MAQNTVMSKRVRNDDEISRNVMPRPEYGSIVQWRAEPQRSTTAHFCTAVASALCPQNAEAVSVVNANGVTAILCGSERFVERTTKQTVETIKMSSQEMNILFKSIFNRDFDTFMQHVDWADVDDDNKTHLINFWSARVTQEETAPPRVLPPPPRVLPAPPRVLPTRPVVVHNTSTAAVTTIPVVTPPAAFTPATDAPPAAFNPATEAPPAAFALPAAVTPTAFTPATDASPAADATLSWMKFSLFGKYNGNTTMYGMSSDEEKMKNFGDRVARSLMYRVNEAKSPNFLLPQAAQCVTKDGTVRSFQDIKKAVEAGFWYDFDNNKFYQKFP